MNPMDKTHQDIQRRRRLSAEGHAARDPEPRGADDRSRAARMAAWTRKNGKNDAKNPFSRANSARAVL